MTIAYLSILIMGFVLGLLGGGGSILTVPILVYLFKLNAITSTAYSLFIVGAAASIGAFKHYRSKNLNLTTGVTFAIPGFIGVFISRAYIVPNLPETIFRINDFQLSKDNLILLVFASMMVLASFSMIFGRSESKELKSVHHQILLTLGFCVGIVTGFVGAGGGFIIIPALNKFAGLSIKKSIGTSLFIISVNSLLGFFGDLINIQPDWFLLFSLVALATFGVLIGTYFNSKVPAKHLKKGFGFFVLILGSWILYNQIIN